jgi:hypothetical protein
VYASWIFGASDLFEKMPAVILIAERGRVMTR